MNKPDISRLLEFQKLLLQFSQIERVTHRQIQQKEFILENDAEHSYTLALTAWFLCEYFPELDRDLVIRIALVHDLVEIHAGDTYIYAAPSVIATKDGREVAAFATLKDEWADFPEMLEHIQEYKKRESPEARFVYALDKIMPIMQIYIHDGYTWKQEGITPERLESGIELRSHRRLTPIIKNCMNCS